MWKFLIACFFLLILKQGSGQKRTDYSAYHQKIFEIENLISNEFLDSALFQYRALGERYPRMLARDAFNACQIAGYRRNTLFLFFVFQSANSGIAQQKLLENKWIHQEFKNDTASFQKEYSNGHLNYLKRINQKLRDEMLSRYDLEQKSKGKENYLQICSDNFNRILELTSNGQFPGENLIGVNDAIESPVLPTLCHFPYSYVHLKPYLEKMLQEGNLNRIAIFYLYGFNQARKSILYNASIPSDTFHFVEIYNMPFGFQSADTASVNHQREKAGILSLQAQKRLKSITSRCGIDYLMGYN